MLLKSLSTARIQVFFVFLILSLITPIIHSAPISANADKLKAAYIYQFIQFINWPEQNKQNETEQTFNICLYGKDKINKNLKELHLNRKTGKQLNFIHISKINDISQCHILYLALNKKRSLEKVLNLTKNKPILSISSQSDFSKHGGIIGFVTINNKLRIEINRGSAKQSRIKISAKLFEIASKVYNEPSMDNQL